MKRKIKKPLGLLMLTTTSLFSGCDILKQFADKDIFDNNTEELVFDSMTDDILSDQEVLLTQGKNNGVASNIDNQDDNLAPGSFKIAWYAGGKALKGEEGETAPGDLKGAITEEESGSNNFKFSDDSPSGIVTGRHGMTLVEDYSAVVSSNDNRSKVKEYFDKLAKDIETKFSGDKSTKLVHAIKKLANATGGNIGIGQASSSDTKASALSDRNSVQDIISGMKAIVEIAQYSGIEIQKGDAGSAVVASSNTDATAALNGGKGGAGVGSGAKLAQEVAQADAWAMLDKIVNAKTSDKKGYYQEQNRHRFDYMDTNNKDAGELVTGAVEIAAGIGAKTNADFAAAVALKAMSKDGKFSVHNNDTNSDDAQKIKEAAANAVNKVLSVLNVIIEKITQKRA